MSVEEVLAAVAMALVGGSGVVGLAMTYLRRYIDRKLETVTTPEKTVKSLPTRTSSTTLMAAACSGLTTLLPSRPPTGSWRKPWKIYKRPRRPRKNWTGRSWPLRRRSEHLNEMLRKLSSRKLWTALAGVAAGLALAFGLDQEAVASTAGAVVSVISVVTYIVTEGRIDAAAVKTAIEDVQEAVEEVTTIETD